MTISSRIITQQNAADMMEHVKYILLDIDGVVWSGDTIIRGVPETLEYLRNVLKKQIRFISNNVLLSRQEIVQQFEKKGITGVQESEVYNAGYAAALRLQQLLGKPTPTTQATDINKSNNTTTNNKQNEYSLPLVHGNVFVIGEQGLCDEIQRVLAPGYITYGTELNDMNAIGVPYTSHLFANAWTERILPAPTSAKKEVSCNANIHRADCNNKKSKIDAQTQVEEINANKISLSELKAVAVVAGLDLHFNICKLACASMILQGSPARNLTNESHFTNHYAKQEIEENRQKWERNAILKRNSESISDVNICRVKKNERNSSSSNGDNSCESKWITSTVAPCTPTLYIATNPDPCDPAGVNLPLMPASGSIIAALNTCSTRLPHAICGKPELDMAQILFANEHISNPSETCLMIGDRLTTDIAFGNAAGCKTMLVLSGVDQRKDVKEAIHQEKRKLVPNYIADSLAVFLPSGYVCDNTAVNNKRSSATVNKAESMPLTTKSAATSLHSSKSPVTFTSKL